MNTHSLFIFVLFFVPIIGQTRTTANLSQPRSYLAATTVGDLAIFAGGLGLQV